MLGDCTLDRLGSYVWMILIERLPHASPVKINVAALERSSVVGDCLLR
jgi:hypothetical protein